MHHNHNIPLTLQKEINQLKTRLLHNVFKQTEDPSLYFPIGVVAEDAATLASLTPHPLLFLPGIFEEKVQAVISAREKVGPQNPMADLGLAA